GGSVVFTDFGADLSRRLDEMGLATSTLELGTWYAPEDVTWLATEEDWHRHQELAHRGGVLASFRYNSVVFVSKNHKLPLTEERYLPESRNENAYEHWHRYCLAAECVEGKAVLDIACGEGYGSAHLARRAATVLGVDAAPDVVAYAR